MIGFSLTVNDLAPGPDAVAFLRKLADAFEALGGIAARVLPDVSTPAKPRPAAAPMPDAASTDPEPPAVAPEPEKPKRGRPSKTSPDAKADAAPEAPATAEPADNVLTGDALVLACRTASNKGAGAPGIGGAVVRAMLAEYGVASLRDMTEDQMRDYLPRITAKLEAAGVK